MKTRVLAFTLAILLFGAGVGFTHYFLARDPSFVKVPPQEKEMLAERRTLFVEWETPSLTSNVFYSDVIVKAKVLEKGYLDWVKETPVPGDDTESSTWASLKLQVEYCLFGSTDSNIIEFRESTPITLPEPGDTVILFLGKNYNRPYYMPLYFEHSIFTVDKKNRLYSFSKTEDLSRFDGQNKYVLYEAVLREIARRTPLSLIEKQQEN